VHLWVVLDRLRAGDAAVEGGLSGLQSGGDLHRRLPKDQVAMTT